MVSRSIICRSRRLKQITDVRDTGKSQYFVITEFNNCFIIRSPSFCQWTSSGSEAICLFSHKNVMHEQNIICSQTQLDDIVHEQTVTCRQLFAGHVVGFQPMKRKKNLLRMIIKIVNQNYDQYIASIWVTCTPH